MLSVDRQTTCWKQVCMQEDVTTNIPFCRVKYLDCDFSSQEKQIWANSTNVFTNCDATNSSISFNFGMFQPALSNHVPAQQFVKKYFYSFWWGLQNLRYDFLILKFTSFIANLSCYILFVFILDMFLWIDLLHEIVNYMPNMFFLCFLVFAISFHLVEKINISMVWSRCNVHCMNPQNNILFKLLRIIVCVT